VTDSDINRLFNTVESIDGKVDDIRVGMARIEERVCQNSRRLDQVEPRVDEGRMALAKQAALSAGGGGLVVGLLELARRLSG